jgi:hypothetical protein
VAVGGARRQQNDVEGSYLKALAFAPRFAERAGAARRQSRFVGAAVWSHFRKPYGPGWTLAGALVLLRAPNG